MSAQKVAVIYGIGEGDYHGRAFVRALQKASFQVTRDAKQADIIIAHSGGCYFFPPLHVNQKYILIGPPFWPGRSLARSMFLKVSLDFWDFARDGLVLQWLWKTFMNTLHLIRYAIRTVTITLHAHRRRFFKALRDENSIIIRAENDQFLTPDAERILEQKFGRVIPVYTIAGHQHDSCWRFPEPYIAIIKQFAKEDT